MGNVETQPARAGIAPTDWGGRRLGAPRRRPYVRSPHPHARPRRRLRDPLRRAGQEPDAQRRQHVGAAARHRIGRLVRRLHADAQARLCTVGQGRDSGVDLFDARPDNARARHLRARCALALGGHVSAHALARPRSAGHEPHADPLVARGLARRSAAGAARAVGLLGGDAADATLRQALAARPRGVDGARPEFGRVQRRPAPPRRDLPAAAGHGSGPRNARRGDARRDRLDRAGGHRIARGRITPRARARHGGSTPGGPRRTSGERS